MAIKLYFGKNGFCVGKSAETKDREAGDLIGRNLNRKRERESYRKWISKEDYVVVAENWAFSLLESHYSQSKG